MVQSIGPNVFVNGANRGIGFGLVQELAKQDNVWRVFAGVRKTEQAILSHCNLLFFDIFVF